MRTRWRWILGAGALLVVLVVVALALHVADEPLRRRVEAQMNAALKGYKVAIRELAFNPFGFSVDLHDWVVIQEGHPEPPIAYIPKLHASVQWRELVRGHLVADFRFERPEFYVDTRHAQVEARDPVPVNERGWQEAALAIFPLRINAFEIEDGKATYLEKGDLGSVYLWGLDFHAGNIRNIRSREGVYPSDIRLSAKLLQSADLRADGHADFLAVPHPAVKTRFDLDGLQLAYLEPILKHWDVSVQGGTLSSKGEIEYAPKRKSVALAETTLDKARLAYVKRRPDQPGAGEKAGQTAAKVTQQPAAVVHAKETRIVRSELAYADETTTPPYRLFVSDCDVTLANFSNVRDGGGDSPGTATAKGKFMASGDLDAKATFWPRERNTDFESQLRIENTDVRTMNDLWRAYGNFDVEHGLFSLYTDIKVEDGRIDGKVKPIFVDLDVGDEEREKGLGQKIYEGLVAGVAKILTNQPRDQVATETSLSGPLENPQTSVLDVATGLVRNAFFKAILPGIGRARGNPEAIPPKPD